MSEQKSVMESQRDAWINTVLICAAVSVAGTAALLGGGGYALYKFNEVARESRQTPEQLTEKAGKFWQQNGYDVVAFKSYEPGTVRPMITQTIKRKSDGKMFEGTAACLKTCAMTKLATVPSQ